MTLKQLLLAVPVLACTAANAQLTSAVMPVAGDTIELSAKSLTSAAAAGPAGTGVTWDQSALVGNVDVTSVFYTANENPTGLTCGGATGAEADYQGLVVSTSSNYVLNNSLWQVLCLNVPSQQTAYQYTDGVTMLEFPLAYGDSVYDTFSGTVFVDADQGTFTGYTWYKVDGSGTLVLNDGTYSNALRVHRVTVTTVFYLGDTLQTSNGETYEWYNATSKLNILQLKSQTDYIPILEQTQTSNLFVKQLATPTGISETLVQGTIDLFPNPATGNATLSINLKKQANVAYNVIDATGRSVRSFNQDNVEAGSQKFMVDVAGLSSGLYMIHYTVNGQSGYSKLFVR